MDRQLSIPGLPDALAKDGWWLDEGATPPRQGGGGDTHRGARRPGRLVAVLALVALADLLFWGRAPGLSVVIFAAALLAWGLQGSLNRSLPSLPPDRQQPTTHHNHDCLVLLQRGFLHR